MCRSLRSPDIGQELGYKVPWKEVRDVFSGRFLGCRERCDRLAEGGGPESPVWLCHMLSVAGKANHYSILTY